MADNVNIDTLTPDVPCRTKDRSGTHTQILGLDLNPAGASEVLMSASALSDAASNPTVPTFGSNTLIWNGTGWDRVRGDITNGIDVDVTRVPNDPFGLNADAASTTGSISAKLRQLAANGIAITGIASGDNNIGNVDVLTVPADPFGTNADAANVAGSISAKLRQIATNGIPVSSALPAGDNNIGNVDVFSLPITFDEGNVEANTPRVTIADDSPIVTYTISISTSVAASYLILDGWNTSGLPAGNNNIGNIDVLTVPADPFGVNADVQSPSGSISAKLRYLATTGIIVTSLPALPTGTNNIGNTGNIPLTSGGLSGYSFLSTAAVQAAAIKASAGQVYKLSFFNKSSSIAYVRLYNQTSSPGTGDTANIIWRGMIPANTAVGGWVENFPTGLTFSSGIGIRVTLAVADNDNTSLTANDIMGNVGYK